MRASSGQTGSSASFCLFNNCKGVSRGRGRLDANSSRLIHGCHSCRCCNTRPRHQYVRLIFPLSCVFLSFTAYVHHHSFLYRLLCLFFVNSIDRGKPSSNGSKVKGSWACLTLTPLFSPNTFKLTRTPRIWYIRIHNTRTHKHIYCLLLRRIGYHRLPPPGVI